MASTLEIDSVIKSFGDKQLLTDIYLKCETDNIIGIFGSNGAGKSTLFKILFGTMSAERKFIRIDSKVYDCTYKVKNGICFLPQHNFLPNHLKVEKAVSLYIGKKTIDNFFYDEVITSFRKSKVFSLSGGELRYLEIKLLLSTGAKFVVLDEPFNGISPILIESIKKMIIEKSSTKGIILTDHDYRNVLAVANQYYIIYDGGIRKIKDKRELVVWEYISEFKMQCEATEE